MIAGARDSEKVNEPRRILKLDEDVVNRIAAGEVVQRPSNAVKELIENSLDAGSTSVTVVAKQGGLKLLQIQDNGHGIRREDLPIVCERFTTSKLRDFNDLRSMSTYGFRGEALASITHTARVTITSKTPSSQVAYKAKYCDGKLVPSGPGQSVDPKPCAGVTGTTIMAEDLFYNMDTRRRAFKNPSEQYRGILEVMTRYAVHFGDRGVSFTCKKHGQPSPDLHTPARSNRLGNIRVAYGAALSRELMELQCSSSEHLLERSESGEHGEAVPSQFVFQAKGLVSGANYSAKRSEFILFINDRLVESSSIKKAVEAAYKDILPKNTHPFVYLAIKMPRTHVDVNVHPTKREVHFLHEEGIIESLHEAVKDKLAGANQSRTFYSQVILPDMNLGGISSTPEDDGMTTGGGGKSTDGRSNASVSPSSQPPDVSPPTPCDMRVEAMVEGEDAAEPTSREGGQESSQEDARAAEVGRRRRASGDDKSRAELPMDVGASASTAGAMGGRGASPSSMRSSSQGSSNGGRAYASPPSQQKKTALIPQKLVRTDRTASSLDAFLRSSQPIFSPSGLSVEESRVGKAPRAAIGKERKGASENISDWVKRKKGAGGITDRAARGSSVDADMDEPEEFDNQSGAGSSPYSRTKAPRAATTEEAAEEDSMCICSPDEDRDNDGESEHQDAVGSGGDFGGSSPDTEGGKGLLPSITNAAPKRKNDDADSVHVRSAKKQRPAAGKVSKPFAGVGQRPGAVKKCDCCGGKRPRGTGGSMVLVREDAPEDATVGADGSLLTGVEMEASLPTPLTDAPTADLGDAGGADLSDVAQRVHHQHRRPVTFVDTQCTYNSVRALIGEFKAQTHKGLTQMLKKYTFVGMVDLHLSLMQFNTKLVLVNHTELSKEAFFQMTLRRFGVMPRLPLASPIAIPPLVRAALDLPEAGWTESDGDKDELAQDACKLLEEKMAMLDEYFRVKLSRKAPRDGADADGEGDGKEVGEEAGELCLVSLPLLIEGHSPLPEGLPMFFLRLSTEVDWTEERPCFEGIAAELALYYSILPEELETGDKTAHVDSSSALGNDEIDPAAGVGAGVTAADQDGGLASPEATAIIKHIMYPSFRWALLPPKVFATDGTVMQLACLERLYRVFERC